MTHREVQATAYGGPEVLEVVEVPDLDPQELAEGEVLVEVRAIGVNAWDVKSYAEGSALPVRLGAECSGVVVASRAPQVHAGAEVVVHPTSGAYADVVVAQAGSVVPKPPSLSWEQAAGLMLAGTAAAHLVAVTAPEVGEVVLLHGAAGGVGLFASQLAAHRGARVLGTASPQDHALLTELGVEPCDYRDDVEAWVRSIAPDGVDAVLDAVGTPAVLDLSLAVARDPARVATLVPSEAAAERGITQLGSGAGADPGTELRRAARLDLALAVGEGWLRVVVSETFPLERAADAHRAMGGAHGAGKIVLTP